MAAAELREDFKVSVEGLLTSMQHAARAMRARTLKEPSPFAIVNISSTATLSTYPALTAYSAAKAAVLQMTRSAALELAPFNIRWLLASLGNPLLRFDIHLVLHVMPQGLSRSTITRVHC